MNAEPTKESTLVPGMGRSASRNPHEEHPVTFPIDQVCNLNKQQIEAAMASGYSVILFPRWIDRQYVV